MEDSSICHLTVRFFYDNKKKKKEMSSRGFTDCRHSFIQTFELIHSQCPYQLLHVYPSGPCLCYVGTSNLLPGGLKVTNGSKILDALISLLYIHVILLEYVLNSCCKVQFVFSLVVNHTTYSICLTQPFHTLLTFLLMYLEYLLVPFLLLIHELIQLARKNTVDLHP